jgi:ribonucleoside-diphosphate reductase alpha chain
MKNTSLASYVFTSKYPKFLPAEQRRETWDESTARVIGMHQDKYGLELPHLLDAYQSKLIGGSQRGLQFGGLAIEQKNERIYNCTVSHCDRLDFFKECFFLLLCGCGTGFSVQKHHVAQLPPVHKPQGSARFVIEDSIEGWAAAAHQLLSAFMGDAEFPLFDYSEIRPKGAALTHGGQAPGPAPLRKALNKVRALLMGRAGDQLRPVDAFDITMHLADAVISGGIRRSATIAVFSADDEEMMTAKTGNWFVDNPQRGRANISAMITPDIEQPVFDALFQSTKEFGEPGFIFCKSAEYLYNPCVEIGMAPVLIKYRGRVVEQYNPDLLSYKKRERWESKGYTFESGWQFCNLSTINCSNIKTEEEFCEAAALASELGTLQAGYTSFPFLGSVSEEITRREALIGVSMMGIMSDPMFYDKEVLSRVATRVRLANQETADRIGIRAASRTTCVKPEGTASLVFESSAGIHPYHAKRYIRRVQADMMEPLYQEVERTHPVACETSVWGADTQRVVHFACSAPDNAVVKSDLTALQHLHIAKEVNLGWVRSGSAHLRCEGLHHNVSLTVSVGDDEWEAVRTYLWLNREYFTGVSLLSSSGDYVYQQPPLQEVLPPEEIAQDDPHRDERLAMWDLWNTLASLPELSLGIIETEDNTNPQGEIACGPSGCSLEYNMESTE